MPLFIFSIRLCLLNFDLSEKILISLSRINLFENGRCKDFSKELSEATFTDRQVEWTELKFING